MARLVPEQSLPAQAFVPGGPFPRPADTSVEEPYLFGLDLFNHGYYWEAHEAWEALWHAAGRRGPPGDFLKGLIKLAAAGVKVREGQPAGVVNHGRRAAELFEQVRREGGVERVRGLELAELIRHARKVAERPPPCGVPRDVPVAVVFDFTLRPGAEAP